MYFCRQADPSSLLAHVNKNARTGFIDLLERGMKLIPAIAALGSKYISRQTFAMHANKGRFFAGNSALHQGNVMNVIDQGTIKIQRECSIVGGKRDHFFPLNENLSRPPIGDQILDRTNL